MGDNFAMDLVSPGYRAGLIHIANEKTHKRASVSWPFSMHVAIRYIGAHLAGFLRYPKCRNKSSNIRIQTPYKILAALQLYSISRMKTSAIIFLLCVYDSHNKDVLFGSTVNSTLTYMEVAYNNAEPAKSWEDDVIYFSGKVDKTIKAIKVQDLDETNEKDIATINAGGVGHNFVNISLKSEQGYSLNYKIEIYS